jgi:hypothetical protein
MALRDFLIAPPEPDSGRKAAAHGQAGDVGRRDRFWVRRREPQAGAAGGRGRFWLSRREPQAGANALAASIGVLAPARDVLAVALAVGVVVARRHPAALVCVHAPAAVPHAPALRAPAVPAAARLAASVRARDLSADARGKVALAELATADAEPAVAAARAVAAAGPLPTVLAVAARDPDLDALLSTQDAIVVALPPSTEAALAELAATSACALTANAASMTLTLDPASRTLALAGLRAPAAVRAAVEALLA